jgi:pimeloyl-ACP methyl ester carboxylesterase
MDGLAFTRPSDATSPLRSADGTPLAATWREPQPTLPEGAHEHSYKGLAPVLLAHGFGQTRHSWGSTQARLAAAGRRSLAFDMRGHGASGRNAPGRDYEAAQFVDDLCTAAAALGGRPVLVGASMGGLTGLLAQAAHAPFSALVLVDVTPRWEAAGMQRIQGFMRAHPDGFATLDDAADAIAAYLPQRAVRKSPRQLEALLHPDATGRLRWHWDVRLLDGFVANSARLQAPLEAAARAVRLPTLLLSGGRSDLVSDATIAHFLDLVPQALHVRLPDATHMLAGDDNDAFADALLEFLRAQSPARSLPAQSLPPQRRPPVPGPTTATPAGVQR